jgi:hypothetical protein
MGKYTINSDAYLTTVEAESFDAAAVALATSTPGLAGVTDLDSLLDRIESIDGAWMWIENAEGIRHYAGAENM